ncbi:MAG: hypothetical protein GX442_16255 [Candidatus Riflebacteria bacterium]|nr:hypothetical protein [Candidatus Riflebacteria bacterium]
MGKGIRWVGTILAILLVGGIVLVPKILREGRVQATQKACLAAQRVLAGAVEIYLLDHASATVTPDLLASGGQMLVEAKALPAPIDFEVSGLREIPYPKDRLPRCEIRIVGEWNTSTGFPLECTLHGSPDRPATFEQLRDRLHLNFWGEYSPP